MTDDHRQRILQAAARIYTQHGWRGATTKRIAEEAGVNEVTLFRHFGAKDALLEQMMLYLSAEKDGMLLPVLPEEPQQELEIWARAHHREMCNKRPFIRQLMSDLHEHPDLRPCATQGANSATTQLREYVERLHAHGFIDPGNAADAADMSSAVTMLMGAIFADGMNRDLMPEMFTQPVDLSLRSYVRLFLRGLGVSSAPLSSLAHTTTVSSPSLDSQ